jgi:hypothetical protein
VELREAQGWLLDAVVQDNPHELGQGRWTVGRVADRGGKRRDQPLEGKAETLPVRSHASEGFLLDLNSQAHLLGTAVARLEEPCRHQAACRGAAFEQLVPPRVRFAGELSRTPDLQRMAGEEVAVVRQSEVGATVGLGQALHFVG